MIENLKIGQGLHRFLLPTMGGTLFDTDVLYGKRFLLFGWASWDNSREYLPILETFYKKHRYNNFEIISIAFDVHGTEPPMRYLTKYKISFNSLIDAYALLCRLLDVKDVPFSIFVDESGVIKSVSEAPTGDFLSEIECKLSEPLHRTQMTKVEHNILVGSVPKSEILLQECTNLLGKGKKTDAINRLKEAYSSSRNEIIKKQISVLEAPEKFYR